MDPLKDLRSYIEWLKEKGELIQISEPLSPELEIPSALRKIMYSGGPPVLFTNIKGFEEWKIAGNLFSSTNIIKGFLSVNSLEEVGERLIPLQLLQPPSTLGEKFKAIGDIMKLSKFLPSKASAAPFQSNIIEGEREPLNRIPFFKTWPKDGGRYATFPIVITKDPETGVLNMGVYRIMIIDGKRGVIHWQIHKRGALAQSIALEKGLQEIPVAIAIGSDPGTMLAAVSPVPYPIDKALFAGVVRGKGIEMLELPNGIPVPSNAEVVIEGRAQLKNLVSEGPFGDHWGYYDKPSEKYPLLLVDRVYLREDPIYYGSVTGLPPLEDAVIGKAIERIFKPILKLLLPEIVEISYPVYGVFQGMVVVSIKKRYPGHAKKVMNALWGLAQSSLTKIIIVVDHDIDVNDFNKVIWALSSNVEPSRDVVILPYAHTDALDPASISHSYGGKLGIDATRKLPEENSGREWPEIVQEDEHIKEKIDALIDRILKEFKRRDKF